MGDSIAAAVRATPDANGWLILPADLPLIQPATLLAVAQGLQRAAACYPSHAGQRGHPIGFSAQLGPELAKLQGDQSAVRVFTAQAAIKIVVNDVGCVTDIDTLQYLEKAKLLLPNT